jgi:diguanylate cyclase (GGDEF)-like protein
MLGHMMAREVTSERASVKISSRDSRLNSEPKAPHYAGIAYFFLFCLFTSAVAMGRTDLRSLNSSSVALVGRSSQAESEGPVASTRKVRLGRSNDSPAPITTISQVRSLSPERSSRLIPVKLHGVVTAFSGYKNSFFLQDRTAGISVDRTDTANVRVGDLVEVTGTSGAGLFAPVALASHVLVEGKASPPAAARVDFGDLFGGAQDSQWIEVEGIVHSANVSDLFGHNILALSLEIGGGSVRILLQDFAGMDSSRLIDSTVRVRGVCSTSFNQRRQFVGQAMFVPDRRDIQIVHPAADPFTGPALPVRSVLQFGQGRHRVKVIGISTYQIPGQALYLQDGEDGIRVQSSLRESVAPGKKVEALGFPVMGDYSPILEDAIFRVVGDAAPVKPLKINAQDVIPQGEVFNQAAHDQQLVKLEGEVVESRNQGEWRVWAMRKDSVGFEVLLPLASSSSPELRNLGTGSVLLVTGVCAVHTDSERNPTSFSILMKSSTDIVVIAHAPWWTRPRVLGLIASLAVVIVLVTLWIVMLGYRVKQQTLIIRESEERFRHLALHDELTGLQNRGAILTAMSREMERCRRNNGALTAILADIDHFKHVNDTYGHLAGDMALQQFVAAISGCIRSYDHVGRYGGEEFLIVFTGIPTDIIEARVVEFQRSISNLTVRYGETEFHITCSLGAILIEPGQFAVDQQLVLALADEALYQAKSDGRNRVVFRTLRGELADRMKLAP